MNRTRRILWRVASFAVAAGFVALWQLIANVQLVSPVFLPGPDRAWAALVRGFSTRRSLEQARRHARTHGLWLARRLHRRHRDRRHDRLVAHDADLCRAVAGVPAAAAGLGDHSGRDRDARADAGDGAVRDRVRRDLADAAGDHPRLRRGRAAALRGGALAADVAARGDLQDRAALRQPRHSRRHAPQPDGGADPVGGLRNPRRPRRARPLGAALGPRVPLGRPVRRRDPARRHRLCDVGGDVDGREHRLLAWQAAQR